MTEAEILALPAGRQLDVLVACRVMGEYDEGAESMLMASALAGEFDPQFSEVCGQEGVYILGPPQYSADREAALRLVEMMCLRDGGHLFTLTTTDPEGWTAWFDDDLGTQGYSDGLDYHSAPLAICRASLRFVAALAARKSHSEPPYIENH